MLRTQSKNVYEDELTASYSLKGMRGKRALGALVNIRMSMMGKLID